MGRSDIARKEKGGGRPQVTLSLLEQLCLELLLSLFSCEGKFQVPFLTSFYFLEKWASKAIRTDVDLRQMAPACGLSMAIQRRIGGGTHPVDAGMLGTQSPGTAPPSPEAEGVGVRGGDSISQLCQEAWEAGARSLRGKVSQESWPTWEPSAKLISDLEKQVQEELPRG